MNIELDNGVFISNVNQYGWGCSIINGNRDLKGNLSDILFVLKNNKNLGKFQIDVSVTPNGFNIPSSITIPIETIINITDNDNKILYNKYIDNSL